MRTHEYTQVQHCNTSSLTIAKHTPHHKTTPRRTTISPIWTISNHTPIQTMLMADPTASYSSIPARAATVKTSKTRVKKLHCVTLLKCLFKTHGLVNRVRVTVCLFACDHCTRLITVIIFHLYNILKYLQQRTRVYSRTCPHFKGLPGVQWTPRSPRDGKGLKCFKMLKNALTQIFFYCQSLI